ncbi:DUF6418 domain-containing protein [Mycolicibacterium vinylchloridicum]|uniref:DUF6418 domain-containing protein n=1 Tax=Mycolicibacterium vinylchloridicum TaxID=2736928 RepID=UPI0015CAA062|nr:DUF6418 domain-containing protein [Mycolicibacterium vinylchloridicum]
MNLWEVMPALSILIVGTALYIWICLRFPPAILLGVIAYSMITKSASVAYIESVQVYLIEVGMISRSIGATPRQILYSIFMFSIALAVIHWVARWKQPEISLAISKFGNAEFNRELRLTLMVSATLLGVQTANALLSPPYGIPGSGVDRQQFWANIRFPAVADLVGVLVFFVPAIAGVALAYGKVTKQQYYRRFSTLLMVAYGIYFILTGARVNGPLTALFIWLSSYWIVLWACGVKLYVRRMGLVILGVSAVFLVAGYLEIADRGITKMTGSAWNGLLYRVFALQGNVSFAADVLTSEGESHAPSLLMANMATTEHTYMPSNLAAAYVSKGVNLVGSLPGNSTLVFGYWVGLVPMAIFAIVLGLIVSFYLYIVLTGRFLLVLPASYMCLWAYNAEAQGSFGNFFTYKFYLFVALVIIAMLVSKGSARQRRGPRSAATPKPTPARR